MFWSISIHGRDRVDGNRVYLLIHPMKFLTPYFSFDVHASPFTPEPLSSNPTPLYSLLYVPFIRIAIAISTISISNMAETTFPLNPQFCTLIGTNGADHTPWSLNSFQTGLRFSDGPFTILTQRCISDLKSNQLYGVNLQSKERRTLMTKITTKIISKLQLPDHAGAISQDFTHNAVGQLLRKLNETETHGETARSRESPRTRMLLQPRLRS